MDSSKLSVKFFVPEGVSIHADAFVPVFHRWIQQRLLPGHQLIDVADYKHVPDGPGTVLVSHEANLYTDSTERKFGLLYVRKSHLDGDLATRLREILRPALLACKLLEEDAAFEGKLKFRTDVVQLRIYDRLLAPNTEATFAEVRPAYQSVLSTLFGSPVALGHVPNDETLFEVNATSASHSTVSELLSRLD